MRRVALLIAVIACAAYRINPFRAVRALGGLWSGLRGIRLEIHEGSTAILVNVT